MAPAIQKGKEGADWPAAFRERVEDAILRLRDGESRESIRFLHGEVVVGTAWAEMIRRTKNGDGRRL
jgi:hypothetical protein